MANETIKSHLTRENSMFESHQNSSGSYSYRFVGPFNPSYGYNAPGKARCWYVEVPHCSPAPANSGSVSNYKLFNRCSHVKAFGTSLFINTHCRHSKTIEQFNALCSYPLLDEMHASNLQHRELTAHLKDSGLAELTQKIEAYFGLLDSDSFLFFRDSMAVYSLLSDLANYELFTDNESGYFDLNESTLDSALNKLTLEALAPHIAKLTVADPKLESAPLLFKPNLNSRWKPGTSTLTAPFARLVMKYGIELDIGRSHKTAADLVPLSTQLLFHKAQQPLFAAYPQELTAQ